MHYQTFIWKPNGKINWVPSKHIGYVIFTIGICLVMKWFDVPSGAITTIFGILVPYFAQKIYFEKENDPALYGQLEGKLLFSTDSITFSNNQVLISELRNIKITTKDYSGKRRFLFWRSFGIDNSLRFEFKNKKYSFQFLIKSKGDVKIIRNIAGVIGPKSQVKSFRYLK